LHNGAAKPFETGFFIGDGELSELGRRRVGTFRRRLGKRETKSSKQNAPPIPPGHYSFLSVWRMFFHGFHHKVFLDEPTYQTQLRSIPKYLSH
jgi:hypothetical protein